MTADESLVHGLRRGDHSAFERLYDTYRAPIYNLCARILGDREEAQDVTQEVFIKAFSRVPAEGLLELRSWLYRVATNASLNHLRSRKRAGGDGGEVDEVAGKVDGFVQSQTVANVEETLQRLNERYRTALVLKDLHGLRSEEIASVLDVPRGAADVLVHRARGAFRRAFAEVAGDGARVPVSLGVALAPLPVPAALQAMPPVSLVSVAPPAHVLPPLGGSSGGLLAKLATVAGSKFAVVSAAALVVGGVTVDRLAGESSPRAAALAVQAVAAASSAASAPGGLASRDWREHWAGHRPPHDAVHGAAGHSGGGRAAHDAGHAGSDDDSSATTHAAPDETGTHDVRATVAPESHEASLPTHTTVTALDSGDGEAPHDTAPDGGSE